VIRIGIILEQLVAKAEETLRRLSADEETIRMYQLREKYLSDQKAQVDGARIAGKIEGKTEKAIKIAKSLLKILSMSVEVSNHMG
jgi:hypothetical protein